MKSLAIAAATVAVGLTFAAGAPTPANAAYCTYVAVKYDGGSFGYNIKGNGNAFKRKKACVRARRKCNRRLERAYRNPKKHIPRGVSCVRVGLETRRMRRGRVLVPLAPVRLRRTAPRGRPDRPARGRACLPAGVDFAHGCSTPAARASAGAAWPAGGQSASPPFGRKAEPHGGASQSRRKNPRRP